MRMDPEARPQGPLIRGFAGNGFRVDDTLCSGALAITPLWARDWAPPSIDLLGEEDVAELIGIEPRPEFLLLGTGKELRRPSPAFTAALEARGIGVEPMDSRAAARAWGMVRSEGRWIAGALYPLDA
jgi:uncharacterized protein